VKEVVPSIPNQIESFKKLISQDSVKYTLNSFVPHLTVVILGIVGNIYQNIPFLIFLICIPPKV
jgi:hypothetical protein